MKFILKILRRLAAFVYAVTLFPAAFVLETVAMAALTLLMPVEWVLTGENEYTSAGILFFLSDYTGYLLDIFKTITGD